MINPITHSHDADGVQRYRVEPYVVAADVYSTPPHVGRGGWTWYTGAAGVDVPGQRGIGARAPPRRHAAGDCAVHPGRLAGVFEPS